MSVIAVDVDDTIVVTPLEHGSPGLKYPMIETIEAVKALRARGWNVAIWSHRGDSKNLRTFCGGYGLNIDAVNAQPDHVRPDHVSQPHGLKPYKLHADIYLDDKAVNPLGKTRDEILHEIEDLRQRRIMARLGAGAHRGDTP